VEQGLAGVVQQVVQRLDREASGEQVRRLLTATYLLTGLRIPRARARVLFEGVQVMRDSDTYQAILDEGRIEEARKLLLRLGQKRFGPADEAVSNALTLIEDLERLEQMIAGLDDTSSWQELLEMA
jgi:hypothetical protein